MGAELADALEGAVGAGPVTGLRRLSGGASRETWSFAAGERPLILQRSRPGGARRAGMAAEAALLRAARAEGVPVPAVVVSDAEAPGGALGDSWMVVEHVAGETIARKILHEDYALARAVLAGQCGTALARIHRIPPGSIPGLTGGDQVAQLQAVLDAVGEPHPAFELGFRWLDRFRPAPSRPEPAVVHGDFRLGNLIVGPDGLRAVIDWELAHTGDPLEDLGWLCVRAWRFGEEPHVGGFGRVDDLVTAYAGESGTDVDRDALAWWEVLGTLKWGIICAMQAHTHLTGTVRSVELAAIGRRVCEVESDLLRLLP
jgi:aminoglycoside phosphotransferase (APT) family kinase protein